MGFVEVGHGSLGKAKEQRTADSPSHTGSFTAKRDIRAGEKIYLSAWVKTGPDGRQFFSINSSEPDDRAPQRAAPPSYRPHEDDIPF